MLFNSFEFLLFLPIVFLLYWFVFRGRQWRNLLVVVASYVFYGWWDWRFLLLIALTSFFSFASGLLMEHYEGCRSRQRAVSAANIIVNLGILGVFKYYNFFVSNLDALLSTMGFHMDWATMNIILPVGISFYTFQALSYSIDVYRKKMPATHDIVEFFAYISFFPQLVAGPIERATNLLPQFQQNRTLNSIRPFFATAESKQVSLCSDGLTKTFNYARATDGLRQMLWGFVKKVVVADNCAIAVNQIWANPTDETGLVLALGALLFTFQIYCDFSGYSDIAIGCARLFGIDLMRNFNFPYFSRSIPEFWRRWHISLMTWFRDYIYIPLGGSRGSRWATVRNTLLVFAISGLWHGANWTFVAWGLYHGLLISLYVMMGWKGKPDATANLVKSFLQALFTFVLVVVGWIIFRAESIRQAYDYLYCMFCSGTLLDISSVTMGKQALMWSLLIMVAEWFQRDKQHVLQLPATGIWRWTIARWTVYYGLLALMLFQHGEQSEFIYFQF